MGPLLTWENVYFVEHQGGCRLGWFTPPLAEDRAYSPSAPSIAKGDTFSGGH
jgi:hypothetical protein